MLNSQQIEERLDDLDTKIINLETRLREMRDERHALIAASAAHGEAQS